MGSASRRSQKRAGRKQRSRNSDFGFTLERLEDRRVLAGDGDVPDLVAPPASAAAIASMPHERFRMPWQGRTVHAVPGEFLFQFASRVAPAVPQGWSVRGLGTGSWVLNAPAPRSSRS